MKKIKLLVFAFIISIFLCIIYVFCKKGLIETIGFAAYVAPIFSVFIAGAVYYEDSDSNAIQKDELPNKNEDPQKKSYIPSITPLFLGTIFQLIYTFKDSIEIEKNALMAISTIIVALSFILIKISSNKFKTNPKQHPFLRTIMIWGLAPFAIIIAATIILLIQKLATQ